LVSAVTKKKKGETTSLIEKVIRSLTATLRQAQGDNDSERMNFNRHTTITAKLFQMPIQMIEIKVTLKL
jgi:hypothetical protein